MTQNQINWLNAKENIRHNQVSERETIRHNKTEESINLGNLTELQRHQLRTEAQTDVSLREIGRHNFASESVANYQAQIAAAQQAETARHNVVQEAQGWVSTQAMAGLQGAQAQKVLSEVGTEQFKADVTKRHYDRADDTAFFKLAYDDKSSQADYMRSQAAQSTASTAAARESRESAQQWVKVVSDAAKNASSEARGWISTGADVASTAGKTVIGFAP